MSATVTATKTASTTRTASKKSKGQKSKGQVRPFGTSAKRIGRMAAEMMEGNEYNVGSKQTDWANSFLNAQIEWLLADICDTLRTAHDNYAQPGNAGHRGKSFKTLKANHFDGYLDLKHTPDDAATIRKAIGLLGGDESDDSDQVAPSE